MQRLTARDGQKYLYLPLTVPQKILIKQRTAVIAILVALMVGAGFGVSILGGAFAASPPPVLNCLGATRTYKVHRTTPRTHYITAGGHLVTVPAHSVTVTVRTHHSATCRVILSMWAAGDRITGTPYVYGGAHGVSRAFTSPAYDCSSSSAYVLYYGGFVDRTSNYTSLNFVPFVHLTQGVYLLPGPGKYITIYANPGHMWMYVNGRWWDDGAAAKWWTSQPQDSSGFIVT